MGVLVDSNVLLDVLHETAEWSVWSTDALAQAANQDRLIINAIIDAEISARFSRIEDLEEALLPGFFTREAIPYEAAFLAAKAFAAYRKRGGTKSAPLPDFFIGAHAAVFGYQLLTRDVARYRSYFPSVALISPD
jgi:predicted nucleic acid-binding protein